MLIKWIVCHVLPDKQNSFSEAQEKWSTIASTSGFIGQFGGWDLKRPEEACILSIWRNQESFDNFMMSIHDDITDGNNQASTYKNLQVKFFVPKMDMKGQYDTLFQAAPFGSYIRIADCFIKEESRSHFLNAQESVWIPAMSKTKGMLGGSFNEDIADNKHYLVTTFWDNEENHSKYTQSQVPRLRDQADVSNDLTQITGRFIQIENSWSVFPSQF